MVGAGLCLRGASEMTLGVQAWRGVTWESQSQEVLLQPYKSRTSFIMTLLILPDSAMLIVFAAMMTYFSFDIVGR